jgi:hypothetical protein
VLSRRLRIWNQDNGVRRDDPLKPAYRFEILRTMLGFLCAGSSRAQQPPRPRLPPRAGAFFYTRPGRSGTRRWALADLIARRANHLIACPAPFAKIFSFSSAANHFTVHRYPAPTRGAYRDRHGRWARDAMDAAVSGGRIARQTNGTVADGEVVWS